VTASDQPSGDRRVSEGGRAGRSSPEFGGRHNSCSPCHPICVGRCRNAKWLPRSSVHQDGEVPLFHCRGGAQFDCTAAALATSRSLIEICVQPVVIPGRYTIWGCATSKGGQCRSSVDLRLVTVRAAANGPGTEDDSRPGWPLSRCSASCRLRMRSRLRRPATSPMHRAVHATTC
jgi:hypothetical protein